MTLQPERGTNICLLLCVQLLSQHSDFCPTPFSIRPLQIEIATVLIQEVTSWHVQTAYAFEFWIPHT